MIKQLLNKSLLAFGRRFDYDVGYQQSMLQTNLKAFLKFGLFQMMSAHRQSLPVAPFFAAKLGAAMWDDCGPCSQLVVNMALDAEVSPEIVSAIVGKNLDQLPEEVAMVVKFTDLVLAHDPDANDLREKIVDLWGDDGLLTLAFCISTARVYPAIKYTLGYGQACNRISVNEQSLIPLTLNMQGVK